MPFMVMESFTMQENVFWLSKLIMKTAVLQKVKFQVWEKRF